MALLHDHHSTINGTTAHHRHQQPNHHHRHGDDVVVVMVPLPAQGHLNQLLHLSLLISSSYPNIPVHFAASATHVRQARLRLHGWDATAAATTNILFEELPAPPFRSPPPVVPTNSSTNSFPDHLLPVMEEAAEHLRRPIAELLRTLSASARRIAIIHDSLMASSVQDFTSLPNAESYAFHSISTFASLSFRRSMAGKPPLPPETEDDVPPLDSIFSPKMLSLCRTQHRFLNLCSGKLYNTCNAMEEPFIKLLCEEEQKHVWAIGPVNQVTKKPGLSSANDAQIGRKRHGCLEWLDKQPAQSVLYVSFGTTTSMTKPQIDNLANGLERSRQKFIWVVRVADRGDVFAVENDAKQEEEKAVLLSLPEGFEERMTREGMGMVIRDWAPQADILGHPAVGGFMSHCGWNSCVESLGMGVPIAAWPFHSDQPRNAILLIKHLKVGVVVRDWPRRHEIVTSRDIENAVRMLMASEQGDGMRRKATELGQAIQQSAAKDGESRAAFNSFIDHITR